MRLIKYLSVTLCCCVIFSCGLIKTGYNNAPSLTIWWLDGYFDLTQAQIDTLKPALVRLHNWHRQSQLPNYVTLLQEIQSSLANEQISAREVCEKIDAVKFNIQTLQLESVPITIEAAPLLNNKQLEHFRNKLGKRANKWKKDFWQETKLEQLDARLEKIQDFAEKVYGDLNNAQLTLLEQSLNEFPLNPAISYAEILRRNDDAFQILNALQNTTLSRDEKSLLVKAGFARLQKSPNQVYQNYADKLNNHSCKVIADLHATTDTKQKLHAKNWLSQYIVQVSDLQIE